MQYDLDLNNKTALICAVHERLIEWCSEAIDRYIILDPVSQLVMSMLGGRTKSAVSRQAHTNILTNYRSWSDVRDRGSDRLFRYIRHVTHAEQKAPRIVQALHDVTNASGVPDLSCLENLSVEAAHQYLESLLGVGRKTGAAVINTSYLRQRSIVIDTHHKRILSRLGCIGPRATFMDAYNWEMPLIPQSWSAEKIDCHHMMLKRLGQEVCRHSDPDCDACPLSAICPKLIMSEAGWPIHRRDQNAAKEC